jgi:hypothetical protein
MLDKIKDIPSEDELKKLNINLVEKIIYMHIAYQSAVAGNKRNYKVSLYTGRIHGLKYLSLFLALTICMHLSYLYFSPSAALVVAAGLFTTMLVLAVRHMYTLKQSLADISSLKRLPKEQLIADDDNHAMAHGISLAWYKIESEIQSLIHLRGLCLKGIIETDEFMQEYRHLLTLRDRAEAEQGVLLFVLEKKESGGGTIDESLALLDANGRNVASRTEADREVGKLDLSPALEKIRSQAVDDARSDSANEARDRQRRTLGVTRI